VPFEELAFIIALAAVNLAAGVGLALLLARRLAALPGAPVRLSRCMIGLLAVYFAECVAFAAGMATQVFTVGLAVLWGAVFGLRLRARAAPREALRLALMLGLYTSVPTASFGILLLLAKWITGGDITTVVGGAALGIPGFVPWPLNTILGFSVALVAGTVVLKTAITVGVVGFVFGTRGGQTTEARDAVEHRI
jgi:hypothetical protein